jgi:hypothetical protein
MSAANPGPTAPASLLEVQSFLAGVVRNPRPLGESGELRERLEEISRPNAKLGPVDRVDIYREQFWLRHVHSLKEDFPTLVHLLREDAFQTLCERYLEAFPPRHFQLRNLSAEMAQFLASDSAYASDPLLADCAKMEWAFIDAVDAADPEPFDATALAGASEEALLSARFVMQAPLRLVETAHSVHEYRDRVRAGEKPTRPEPRSTYLVVFRTGETLRYFELERPAFEVVRALAAGTPLGEACGRAVEAGLPEAEVSAHLGQWFQWWTQWNWMSKVVL